MKIEHYFTDQAGLYKTQQAPRKAKVNLSVVAGDEKVRAKVFKALSWKQIFSFQFLTMKRVTLKGVATVLVQGRPQKIIKGQVRVYVKRSDLKSLEKKTDVTFEGLRLQPPPTMSKGVCSEYSNMRGYVEPIALRAGKNDTVKKLLHGVKMAVGAENIINLTDDKNSTIIAKGQHRSKNRLHLEVKSKLGFIDDVDLRIDREHGLVHVRSVARSGFYDFGVNAKRVMGIRSYLS